MEKQENPTATDMDNKEVAADEIDFSKPWDDSDLALIVEDKPIYVNKGVLALWSPVMKAMFTQDFKEKEATEIPLPGKKFKEIMELVEVLHPSDELDATYNIEALLGLAREYQMKKLTRRCETVLLNSKPSVENLVLAIEFNLEELHQKSMQYATRAIFEKNKNVSILHSFYAKR